MYCYITLVVALKKTLGAADGPRTERLTINSSHNENVKGALKFCMGMASGAPIKRIEHADEVGSGRSFFSPTHDPTAPALLLRDVTSSAVGGCGPKIYHFKLWRESHDHGRTKRLQQPEANGHLELCGRKILPD
jgi:hypothetical protein